MVFRKNQQGFKNLYIPERGRFRPLFFVSPQLDDIIFVQMNWKNIQLFSQGKKCNFFAINETPCSTVNRW
jgi:hypothetical protein